MQKGLFITFEGGDGSGKTTQLSMLENYLTNKGKKVICLREPGGTNVSEEIRKIILDKNNNICPETEALLYAAARAQVVFEIIQPSLKSGYIVLSDRFLDSSIAYQGVARNLGVKKINDINFFATKGLTPDLTFFMNIKPEDAIKRRAKVSELDRIELEKMDFHEAVYNGYKLILEENKNRVAEIDATKEPIVIHEKIIDLFNKRFKEVIL